MLRSDKLISVVAGAVLLGSALVPSGGIPNLIPCPFKLLTGWPCPGCGLTHAFCDISHAQWMMAWSDNPFGFLFYALALGCLGWPWLAARFPSLKTLPARRRAGLWAPPTLVAIMWAFDIARIAFR
jgi:Protein of unknown function (DUF2752)